MTKEFGDLRWAIVAAEHRSLRKAASVLNLRQSTLSRRILDLEHRLGWPVFERTNGGTRTTAAGQDFLDAAKRIIEDTEALITRFKSRSRGENGNITLGVHASLSAGNLRSTLIEFHDRFPKVEASLVDGASDRLLSDVAGSTIDVAFVAQGSAKWNGKSLPVWSERVVIALPECHALASRSSIRWSDLQYETLLVPQRGPGPEFLRLLISRIGDSGFYRLVRQDVSLDRLLTLVSAGWGLLLALEGATGVAFQGVTFREIHDVEGPVRLGFHAYWRQANENPSLRSLLDILRERYPDLSGNTAPG